MARKDSSGSRPTQVRRSSRVSPGTRVPASGSSAVARSSHGSSAVRADDRVLVALARPAARCRRAGPARTPRRSPPAVGDEQQVVAAAAAGRLRAAGDLVEDRLAVLAAGILVGHDHEAGALAGDPAHHRPLRGVPLARRAEDRDQPAAAGRRDRREQVEDGLERRRAVGVVDDDPERLAGIDPLHPARARPSTESRPGADGRRIEAERLAQGDDRERVVDVEAAGEAELERSPRPAAPSTSTRRRRRVLLDCGSPGRRPRRPCRTSRSARRPPGRRRRTRPADGSSTLTMARFGQADRARLSRVARAAREPLEQRQLRVAVRLPRAVELEVLVGEVREDRDVVGDAADPVERRARARSSRRRAASSPASTIARSVAWSSGASGVVACSALALVAPADPRRDRPDHARSTGRPPRARRRPGTTVVVLPSVPVIPTTAELVARVAVPPGRRVGEGGRAAVDDELRQRRRRAAAARRSRRRRPPRRPRSTKSWPSTCCAGDGDEQRRRARPPRVVGHAADRDRRERRRADRPCRRRARRAGGPSAASRSMSSPSGRGSAGSAAARSSAIVGVRVIGQPPRPRPGDPRRDRPAR